MRRAKPARKLPGKPAAEPNQEEMKWPYEMWEWRSQPLQQA